MRICVHRISTEVYKIRPDCEGCAVKQTFVVKRNYQSLKESNQSDTNSSICGCQQQPF